MIVPFQVFALNENLNVIGIIKKSVKIVKGNFLKVSFLLILLWAFTYSMLPELFNFIFDKLNIYNYLIIPVIEFCKNLPLKEVEQTVTTAVSAFNKDFIFEIDLISFSKRIVSMVITSIIIGFTLPLRSICCTLLYKNLEIKKLKEKKLKEL